MGQDAEELQVSQLRDRVDVNVVLFLALLARSDVRARVVGGLDQSEALVLAEVGHRLTVHRQVRHRRRLHVSLAWRHHRR